MSLLAPAALVALAALVLPLLIHLIRKSEPQPVRFAALRWLGSASRPRQQWRIDERLLLALRLLLIAVLALLLAQPVWRLPDPPPAEAVLVAPGVDAASARAAVDKPLADWRWLARDLPAVGTEADSELSPTTAATWMSLIRERAALLPASTRLTVVVPEQLTGLDAARLESPRNIDWRVVPAATPEPYPVEPVAPIRVVIRTSVGASGAPPDQGPTERRIAEALVQQWAAIDSAVSAVPTESPAAETDPVVASGLASDIATGAADPPIPPDATLLIWLADDWTTAAQRWIEAGGTALRAGSASPGAATALVDNYGEPWLKVEPLGKGRVLTVLGALTPKAQPALREPDAPTALLRAVRDQAISASPPPDRAPASAVAPIVAGTPLPSAQRPLDAVFALFAAVLFALERGLALRASRGAA